MNLLPKGWGQKRRRRIAHGLVLLAIGGFLVLVLGTIQPFHTINLWVSDQLLLTETPSPNIVVVGIDDASLKTYGRWSDWPRSLHAQAIANLDSAGAKTIGYDVVFAGATANDAELAAAMKQAGNVVLAGAGTDPLPVQDNVATFNEYLMPADVLAQASWGIGHANIISDPDGRVRRVPMYIREGNGTENPALSLAVLHAHFNMPLPQEYVPSDGKLDLLARRIPVDDLGFLRVNFAFDDDDLPYISYGDVIRGSFDPSIVRNKIVLVGMTATGDVDSWQTPTSGGKIPGVFIHAAAMDTILRQRYLSDAGIGTTVLIMLLVCAIGAVVMPWFGTWYWTDLLKGTGLTVGVLVAYAVAGSLAADRGMILNLLYPSLTVVGLYVGNTLYVAVREQSDKRFVKSLFGRYVSPEVSKTLVNMATEGKLNLGGEEREVTILFADIRNFTTISEHMNPDAVVRMINYYLPVIIEAVGRNGGMVNKFAGDSIMAVWNAPRPQPDHALNAVKAALEAQARMAALKGPDIGPIPVRFGIGINTGKALAGNVGTTGRSEYTVIGDAVNLASRVCSSTPGGEVWIGPETHAATAAQVEVDALEPQVFKGKTAPVPVFRATGLRVPPGQEAKG